MYKSFEPGYGYGVREAISSSNELIASLASPERNIPDTETIVSLSVDLTRAVGNLHGFMPQYEIGQAKSAIGATDIATHKRFGDAVAHELFIADLLEASHAKPFVADFDKDDVLRGIILALDRENDSKFEALWESVGINYSTVFIAGSRPSDAEVKAISFMRGLNPDNVSLQAPWFLRVGIANSEDTKLVRSIMQMRTHSVGVTDCVYEESSKFNQKFEAIFTDGERYKMFIRHIQRGLLDQSTGQTLRNFELETAALDAGTLYFAPIDKDHKFDSNLLLSPAQPTEEIQNAFSDSEVLYIDELTGYKGRIVASKFLVQTVASFIPGGQWLRISEFEARQAQDVCNIINDEKDAQAQLVKKRSIF